MASKQGYKKLIEGYSRKLTNSEKSRGYLFISHDKEVLQISNLQIVLGEVKINKKIDSYGRIIAGKVLLNQIGDKDIRFKLDGNTLKITY